LQPRKRSEAELRLIMELKRLRAEVNRSLRVAELQLAYIRARTHFQELQVPSRLMLALRDLNLGFAKRATYSRADLQRFWNMTWRSCRRRRVFLIQPHKVVLHFFRDVQLLFLFVRELMRIEQKA